MADYDHDDDYRAPHRAAQFDTMNLGEPHRAAQFDTMNLGPGPQRVPHFDTANLGAPVRIPDPPPAAAPHHQPNPPYPSTGETPIHPVNIQTHRAKDDSFGRIPAALVIASVVLRAAALVVLAIALAIIASDSVTIGGVTVSYSDSSSLKYALAVSIVGALYSIYETVSAGVRLGRGHLLLPGNISLFVSYIGDQVILALLLTGGSAAASTLKDLHDLTNATGTGSVCDSLGSFCDQGAGGVAMIFVGACFLAASLAISSFCFYKNKT